MKKRVGERCGCDHKIENYDGNCTSGNQQSTAPQNEESKIYLLQPDIVTK
jgi:hypothetical protein